MSLADIAAAAGVTAPAVYRHFRNKHELLAASTIEGLDRAAAVVSMTSPDDLSGAVAALVELALERPYLWTLLHRESRNLEAADVARVRAAFRPVITELTARLRTARPLLPATDVDLLTTAATAALANRSALRSRAGRHVVAAELAAAGSAVLATDLPRRGRRDRPPTGPVAESDRRARLLASASELFFVHGYDGVSLDDIGASVGITGPSIYHHFATKSELLACAFEQASLALSEQLGWPAANLDAVVRDYVDYCLGHRRLVGIYVSESMHLSPAAHQLITATLRELTRRWTDAVIAERPELTRTTARLRAHVALGIVEDVVRVGPFHARPRAAQEISALALAALRHT